MKVIAKFLIVFFLFSSVASAWDLDGCEYDISLTGYVQADDGSLDDASPDLCGNCVHLVDHLLGQIFYFHFVLPPSSFVEYSTVTIIQLNPDIYFLFHPPRASFPV